jgi:hypothetical protein
MNGTATADSISTPRASWCARKLIVGPGKKAKGASTTAMAAETRRHCPGAVPASRVTGHAFTTVAAASSTPRTPPRPAAQSAATDSMTGIMSSLPTVSEPRTGTPHAQYQAPAGHRPRRDAAAYRTMVTARSQPVASSAKSSR